MRDMYKSKMTKCKQYRPVLSAKFEDFQNIKFTELSQSAFTFINMYVILTFLGHHSMLNAVYCVHKTCVNRSLSGYTTDFSAYIAVKTVVSISVSNSWIYNYSTRWESGYGETVNNYRRTKWNPFFWKLSKLRAAETFSSVKIVTMRLLRQARGNIIRSFWGYWKHFYDILVSQCR